MKLDQYKISISADNPRGRHPHDSKARLQIEEGWRGSSTGQHMALDNAVWRNPDGTLTGRSTQWGSQVDRPPHYLADGSTEVETDRLNGPAIAIDFRGALMELSDGFAITAKVVRKALEDLFSLINIEDISGKIWERVLLRTLNDEQAHSETPLERFPYFANPEAVNALIEGISERTGQRAKVVFNEPPSVDEANQGYLATTSEDGHGGAHGAFHKHDVLIGESWDLSALENGQTGVTVVDFDPLMEGSQDSALVSNGYFIPRKKIAEVREQILPIF